MPPSPYIRQVGRFLWSGFLWFFVPCLVCSQGVTTDFGKNRIQFHDDFDHWDMYETENFVTYWYGKGREIAHTVVQLAELDNPAIQHILEHKMNDKIELIVYLDLTDLKQSNLGIEDQFVNQSGITKVVENKVFLYFNGDHNALRKSLREGIASVCINAMLHGNNLQEIVQNAVLLNLPDWFQKGLVSYLGEEWSPEMESRLQDYFTYPKKRKKDFARLAKLDQELAGHSMWYFLATSFGKSTISNILYLTRINRSLENGLLYVLGYDSRELARQWQLYFEKKFNAPAESFVTFEHNIPLSKQKLNIPIGQMRFRPDGQVLAYTLNDHGRVRLILYDLRTGEKEVLFRYGVRNYEQEADLNYPVMAWHPFRNELTIFYERRDVIYLMKWDLENQTVFSDKLSPEYHRVYDLDYWSSDTLLLAAATDGYSDIYLYAPKTRQSIRVTEDFYDDLDASVVQLSNKRYILFSSNRKDESYRKMELDSILPIGPFDLYLLDFDKRQSSLRRLTFSPAYSERQARLSDDDALVCLADIDGRWQRIQVSRIGEDPPVHTLLSAYDRDILGHEYVPQAAQIIDWFQKWNQPYIYAHPLSSSSTAVAKKPVIQNEFVPVENIVEEEMQEAEEDIDTGYLFQSRFEVPAKVKVSSLPSGSQPLTAPPPDDQDPLQVFSTTDVLSYDPDLLTPFLRTRVIAARLRFKLDYFNTTMDNEVLFGGLDSYAGTKREFEPSPLGLLVKSSIKDLLENYVITGGARFPTSFNGSEYFLVFDNRRRRIDKQYAIYRKSITETNPGENTVLERTQYVSVLGVMRWSYPFDVYNSVRLSATIRNDRTIALATDPSTLDQKTDDAQRLGLKLEWVYDNSREIDINSRTGTRAKVWTEFVKRFDLNLFESGRKLQFNHGMMTVIGLDARHYVSPDRRTIFAGRLTAATSLGSERILYYLGGVENWLFSSYDQGVGVPQDVNFAYTALAANMRGFKYNARNGSNVVLLNTEVRVPVLQYLSRQKIRSSFLRNIQVVGFVDVGTAWHGSDPFGPKNPLNTVVLYNPPTVQVTVNYYRNPLIVGYGAGVRTMLFGYLAKLDYGWNWESKTNRNPLLHFSIGADF
jgi:hypothetical protein